jgi:hypothetical protein
MIQPGPRGYNLHDLAFDLQDLARAGLDLARDSSSDASLDNGLGLGSEVAADQAAHVTVSGLTLIGFCPCGDETPERELDGNTGQPLRRCLADPLFKLAQASVSSIPCVFGFRGRFTAGGDLPTLEQL